MIKNSVHPAFKSWRQVARLSAQTATTLFFTCLLSLDGTNAAPFTIQLVKSDKPGELVHVLDEVTAKWQADENKGFPLGIQSNFDIRMGLRPGKRVVTWLKHFSVDGKRVFQKRYKNKFLFRVASADVQLADGEHVLDPGGHVVEVQNGRASSNDPDVKIDGTTISVVCYPVQFAGLNMSVDPGEPLIEQIAALPGNKFNIQVYRKNPPPEDERGKDKALESDESVEWYDLLEIHTDFHPLIVYLPPNTLDNAYRILPSRDAFTLSSGKIKFPIAELDSGVHVTGKSSVWIPRYTSKTIFRTKTELPLFSSLKGVFSHQTSAGAVPSDTFEERKYYHQFYEQKTHEFNGGLTGRKPEAGIEIPSDLAAFPHRLLIADNRHPQSNEARLLAVALEKNLCKAGESIRGRIQYRDVPKPETLPNAEVKAFIRSESSNDPKWRPIKVEAGQERNIYRLSFEEGFSGVYALRVVVDRGGSASQASGLHADFQIAIESKDAQSSVSFFTHYNRKSFYEDEGFELMGVVKNVEPLSGELLVKLQDVDSDYSKEVIRRKIDLSSPGRHTLHFHIPPAATATLRAGAYRLTGTLEGCEVYGRTIQLVSRKKKGSLVIAFQPSWEGPTNSLLSDEGLDLLFDSLEEMGLNQLIESPPRRAQPNVAPLQERAFTAEMPGLPSWDFNFEPSNYHLVLDRSFGQGMDFWVWRQRLVENLRWGPLEDLDVDRGIIQFYANLGHWYPHIIGMDLGYWLALEYVDMGSRAYSYPEQQRMREKVFMPKLYKEKFNLEFPTLSELSYFTDTLVDKNNIYDRWRKFYSFKCDLIPETMAQYRDAAHKVNPKLVTALTEQEVMVTAPFAAMMPEIAFSTLNMSRWHSTHENGTRPLCTAFQTALGKLHDDRKVSTIYSMQHFHIPRIRRTNFRLWQRMLMSLACGANEVGYQNTDIYFPVRRMDTVTRHGFTTPSHVLERASISSVNRAMTMYSGIFEHARRQRDVAILHSQTQEGFEHIYFGAEWHNNDPYLRYITTPFHRGAHLLRVESAFSAMLWSHHPADIIGENAIRSGALSKYKGLIITGIDLPRLTDDVARAIQAFIKKGGAVFMDHHCRPEFAGAVKLDFGFNLIRAGWSNRNEYRGMQEEYLKVKERLDAALNRKIKKHIDSPAWDVLLSASKWGESTFLTTAGDRILKDTAFQGAYAREPILTKVNTSFPNAVVYDLFELKKLKVEQANGRSQFPVDLTRVGAKLFAVLPKDIQRPVLQTVERAKTGQHLEVRVSIKDISGNPTNILTPIEITFFEPDNHIRYQVYRAVKGQEPLVETFKIAENDSAGDWRVVARELFGGRASQAVVKVEEQEGTPALGTDVPAVAIYETNRILEFCSSVKKVIIPFDSDPSSVGGKRPPPMCSALQQQLKAIGVQGEIKVTDSFAVVRRNLSRKTSNRGEKQIGPKYIFKGNLIIPDIGGQSALLRSLVEVGILPVRVTREFPGPGRGVILHVVSPFYYNYDALIVSGGDEEGFQKALAVLANLSALKDIGGVAGPQSAVAHGKTATSSEFQTKDVRTFPMAITDGLQGMPVMQIEANRNGKQILIGTENFAKNVFMLNENGKIVWSGKGAKKWPKECRILNDGSVLVVDASGGLYHLNAAGKTIRRFPDLTSVTISTKGDVFIAATRDMTFGMNSDGTILWQWDYFPKRKTYGQLRSGHPKDDLVAISPDGGTGLVFDWIQVGTTGKGGAIMARRIRSVEMRRGRVTAEYNFKPHESVADKWMSHLNMRVQFDPTGQVFTIANTSGMLMAFYTNGLRPIGKHFESGPILSKPFKKPPGSPEGNPAVWRSRTPAQFVDIKSRGSQFLAGFANRKLVLLDSRMNVQKSWKFDGTVIFGAFLRKGFVVYVDDLLRSYAEDGNELWSMPLPLIYTIHALADGNMICGSAGGHVYKIGADGKVQWTTDLNPESFANVDEAFSALLAAEDVYTGPPREQKTQLESLKAEVLLSRNLYSRAAKEKVVDESGVSEEIRIPAALQPFSTLFFYCQWKAPRSHDGLFLSATIKDRKFKLPVLVQRAFRVNSSDWMEAVLPVKTGPLPFSITVSMKATPGGKLNLKSIGLFRAEFGSLNVALEPSTYARLTKESKRKARSTHQVMFRHLEGNLQEAVQPDPLEMTNGRITRVGGSRWTAGDTGQMGGVEVSFPKPTTIGTVAFYDDPAQPKAIMKQYLIRYFVEQEKAEEEKKDEEKSADEIDFTDKWAGDWKTAIIERDSHDPYHIHRLAKPITARRFEVSGLLNHGLSRRDEETRITEVELYEAAWRTEGGNFQRTHYLANAHIEAPLEADRNRLFAGRRFAQATPVFADGTIYLTQGETLHAVNIEDFKTRWSYTVDNKRAIKGTPTIADGLALFGSDDFVLRALDVKSGELVWSLPTEFKITGAPCVADGKAIIGSNDGYISAIDLNTGELAWKFHAGQSVRSSVASDGEKIYFTSFNQHVHALNVKDGRKTWSFKTGGQIRSGVAIAADAVYFGSDDGSVYAVDKATGKQKWSYKTNGYVEASPAIDDSRVYIGSVDGTFSALDRKTGNVAWQAELGTPIRRAALVIGDKVAFHADDNHLYLLNKQTGKELSKVNINRGLTSITPMGDSLIIGTRSGYCFVRKQQNKR